MYAPDAIVHNKGPTTVRDFFKQRTRVNIGEQYMKRIYDYEIPTWNPRYLFSSYLGFLRDNRRYLPNMLAAMAMEGLARVYAKVYVTLDRGRQGGVEPGQLHQGRGEEVINPFQKGSFPPRR